MSEMLALPAEEVLELGAADPSFYSQHWFPETCRQAPPDFHEKMWEGLTEVGQRHVSFMVFRGGAKTTVLRLFVSFCVAYLVSRTILFVGKSQDHARRSVEWLMKQVEFNTAWAHDFGLRKGAKWTAEEIEIITATGQSVRIIALGITGSTRGINVDDYRPDLIVLDDPCDEENTATPEQREKTNNFVFGALDKSLAPRSEAPLAKMVLAQTPINKGDLINLTVKDPSWKSYVFSCFGPDGLSAWPSRWTTDELLADKQAHIDKNMLHIWLREMECRVISSELAAFKDQWLQHWSVLPDGGFRWIAVDPTPPPREVIEGPQKSRRDDAVVMTLLGYKHNVYTAEVFGKKSPDPFELINEIFEQAIRWNARFVKIETVLFARVLKSLLEKEMVERRYFLTIVPVEDMRKKDTRIRQEIVPYASNRRLFVHPSQTALIEQFTEYPASNHDDYLDALAIGLMNMEGWMLEEGFGDTFEAEEDVDDGSWRVAI